MHSQPLDIRSIAVPAVVEPHTTMVSLTLLRLRQDLLFDEGRVLRENEEQTRSLKLPPNPKRRIKTIFNHLFNSPARVKFEYNYGKGIIRARAKT